MEQQYGRYEFWESRYEKDTKSFEWYQDWNGCKDIISQYITKQAKILNVGCGTSKMPEDMLEEKYEYIYNIDQNQLVIDAMKERYASRGENFQFECMDVRKLNPDWTESFDCVIDKGTLDSILCGEDSKKNSRRMLKEIYRVLSPRGVYFCISYAEPKLRRDKYFVSEDFDWKVIEHKIYRPKLNRDPLELTDEPENVKNEKCHYIYVCIKSSN
eukprot:CAMPEP_0176415206 /NCGR_PEP_ID=MMETSP0127-20121128/5680_1 /TAXON_ID=938130 /ORGANISM="Platyophrya macrostoma, Strain WH" /LENGTH=213 /DNA_ID=CAMNT_0017795181 /DNA_START=16 /DNA_END=657 /DNA_ORIENTATION=-